MIRDNTTATENPVGAGRYVDAGDYIVVGPPGSAEVTISTSTDPVVKTDCARAWR